MLPGPLIISAALLGVGHSAWIPSGQHEERDLTADHRQWATNNNHDGRGLLIEAQEEIRHLEEQLLHDLEELEYKQRHHQPRPWQPFTPLISSYSTESSSASAVSNSDPSPSPIIIPVTSSADSIASAVSASANLTTTSISLSTASYFTSVANTTRALQSLSSAASSLSSLLSSISSVNATITLTNSVSTTSFVGSTVLPTSASTPTAAPYPAANSTTVLAPSAISSLIPVQNSTSLNPAGTASSKAFYPANSTTSGFLTGTASNTKMAPTAAVSVSPNVSSGSYCSSMCSSLSFNTEYATSVVSCQAIPANQSTALPAGQASAQCGTTFTPQVDICRVTLSVATSGTANTYMEVWLPNNGTEAWNGRTLSTDNGGANGCVHYVDMAYVSSLGFAAIGDNGGHNSSAFDGGWMYFNNEAILDWAYRARHASVEAGKQVTDQFYGQAHKYSYYLGCSTGGQQGLHSAQNYPEDFDGIIAGSAAADFNHLQAWSGRFVQLTGQNSTDPKFLTLDEWVLVQSYIFAQCDEALDGVNDGIIEDPTICQFDTSAIPVCNATSTSNCLTATQISTVYQVFTELYSTDGNLLYPALLYGSQVDAFRLGQLSGSIQGISKDWYGGAVYNNSFYDALNMNQTDYATADATDALHGNVSSFSGDLSAFHAAGKKMIMYHGMADPLVSGGNSQRYYLKVAQTLGLDNTGLDPFLRYFRISGMAHCGVGGISGAGAWMFGQSGLAAVPGASDNVIWNMVDWVESNQAPDVIVGTKFWWDETALGVQFQRPHCRFPYRTTYTGSGQWEDPSNWSCTFIDDWQQCSVGAHPRLCNVDGSFGA
ncbi:hypothetical protein LTR62_008323 [Meristemomyces frigidus]|uniref:Carboxylic ester hydrolase n=1 Tax=Meristemomyces frigidus TaxID=1508187 RepID=A0AAN7TDL3_9PEZI|nr:hypothetical protein LTR62_008323 [Meristemomyces frigidus]